MATAQGITVENTNTKFWNLRAEKIMTSVVVVIRCDDKIERAATLMAENKISAMPVVHESGACIGILTSKNIVAFESVRNEIENEFKHGYFFDLARYGIEDAAVLSRARFDEVLHHMDREVAFASRGDSIHKIVDEMCKRNHHHVVVLGEDGLIDGIISSIDVLAVLNSISAKTTSSER